MSELDSEIKFEDPVQDDQQVITAGNMLRQAREHQGLSASALASALKVSVKKIEAIESGNFELLPDLVFARALAFSICRNLKIDALPILDKFPSTITYSLKSDDSGINTPFHESPGYFRIKALQVITRPSYMLVILILICVTVVYFFSSIYKSKPIAPVLASVSKLDSEQIPGVALPALEVAQPVESPLTSGGIKPLVSDSDSLVVAGSGAVTGNIIFNARGVSWAEVVDAKGTVQLRKTLAAGEVVGVSGILPLSVVVGKANTLDVTVAGKPFNLMEIAKENVARFEVK